MYMAGLGTRLLYEVWSIGYRAAVCDVTGGVASLNFDATELQIFKVILEAQVTQICSMNILRLTIDFIKCPKFVLMYGVLQCGHFETYH